MRIKKLLIIIILFPMLFFVSCGKNDRELFRLIVSVHDGDTFTDDHNVRYRLYAVDTPETSDQYNNFKSTEGLEKIYAVQATRFTAKMLLNKVVKVINVTNDPYGRTVSRVLVNGQDLSIELVKAGLARVAYIDVKNASPFKTTNYDYFRNILNQQKIAHDNKKGFWSQEKYFKDIFPKA